MIKRALGAATLAALLSACTLAPKAPATETPKPASPAPPAAAPASAPQASAPQASQPATKSAAPLDSSKIESAVKAVVADYFGALVKKDFEKVNSLTTGDLQVQDPASFSQAVEFQEANVAKTQYQGIKLENNKVMAYMEVQVQARFAAGKQGAWSAGENTRFAQLVWDNGNWKLAALATSPPDPTGLTR